MISVEELKLIAKKLMFDLTDEEYLSLQKEFEIVLKQMELLDNFDDLENVEPMVFPFSYESTPLREDEVEKSLKVEEVLKNVFDKTANMIKVKKVV